MDLRERHIEFINFLKFKTGLSVSAIAKRAGVADSTLTRFLSKPEFESLSASTLNKIAKVGGYESYESFLLSDEGGKSSATKVEIGDAEKFEIYESAKRLITKKYGFAEPSLVTRISQEVIEDARKLNTNFISDSLIMYVIEKNESAN